MNERVIILFPKALFLSKGTHPGRAVIMSFLGCFLKMGFTHNVSETYFIGNARHPIADTLSFILGTLGKMKTRRLALWFTKIVPTLENSKG